MAPSGRRVIFGHTKLVARELRSCFADAADPRAVRTEAPVPTRPRARNKNNAHAGDPRKHVRDSLRCKSGASPAFHGGARPQVKRPVSCKSRGRNLAEAQAILGASLGHIRPN